MRTRKEKRKRLLAVCLCASIWVAAVGIPCVWAEEIPRTETGAVEQADAEDSGAQAEPPSQTLGSGDRGEAVLALQERLIALGYDPGTADGIYGSGTKKAVKAFQKVNGLEADGIAGEKTLAALFSADALPMPEKPAPVDVLGTELPLLVNKEHPVGEEFVPADLVDLSEACDTGLVKIKYKNTLAVREAAEALKRMLEAAKADGIVKWQVSAAYRSYENQENILNAKINSYLKKNSGWSRKKARSAALHTVAEPGASEHHTGLAIDINVPGTSSFLGTRQCTWLHANCWDYGFIIRYQEGKESITGFAAEAWHIRYVGVAHARSMRETGMCLEEYLEAIEAGEIEPPIEETEEEIILE